MGGETGGAEGISPGPGFPRVLVYGSGQTAGLSSSTLVGALGDHVRRGVRAYKALGGCSSAIERAIKYALYLRYYEKEKEGIEGELQLGDQLKKQLEKILERAEDD